VAEGALRWLDASGTALNMTGQILMIFAFVNHWFVWFAVDITQIAAFAYLTIATGQSYYISMLVMYIIWTINVVLGFFNWKRSLLK
jgi:nicotinamide riboside transporter PnuC